MGWLKRAWAFVIVPAHSNAIVAIFSTLLFVATTLYTVFAALQWSVIRNQLTEMQNTNRPYIFTAPKFSFPAMPKAEDVREVPVTVLMLNVGVSPALKVINNSM